MPFMIIVIMSNEWLKRYGDRLYAYARSRLSSEEEIFDALQDTFVAALESSSKFQGNSSELTWLTGILRHKIYDIYRAHARRGKYNAEGANIYEEFAKEGRRNISLADPTPGPEQNAQNRQLREIIFQCIDKLPQVQANVFKMRELDNLSTKEICNILSISATHIHVILYRARIHLQQCLNEKGVHNAH